MTKINPMEPVLPSVFDEMEQYKPLNYASTGQRFANMIIDIIAFYLLIIIIVVILIMFDNIAQIGFTQFVTEETLGGRLQMYLFSFTLWFCVFFLTEGLSKGRTLGKLITGTRAVKQDGSPIDMKDAAIRSLSRFIPFEPFSAFSGSGLWHDRLSKTEVVKVR